MKFFTTAVLSLFVPCSLIIGSFAATNEYYTAAVLEHVRLGSANDTATERINLNLDVYRKAAEIAKSQGADIIVFPEYGIFPPGNRNETREFLEFIPDLQENLINPCYEEDAYSNQPILQTLSCLAMNNSMFVVANMGDIQNCIGDPECPSDGAFHYNTNVVFDRNGTLLVKYHKEHLFFELGMNPSKKQQNTSFETDFGTFATYICFDIMFGRMAEVGQWSNIDGFAFPTMWDNVSPFLMSIQFFESWSLGNNATILAANMHTPEHAELGSGIFHPEFGHLAYTFNPDGTSKLVVANVPKPGIKDFPANSSMTVVSAKATRDWMEDAKDVPSQCLVPAEKQLLCFKGNLSKYTLIKLNSSNADVEACNNGLCCTLDYFTSDMFGNLTEDFYLGVYNGTNYASNKYSWCEEHCILLRCDSSHKGPCTVFKMRSDSLFNHVHLSGNFSTNFIYPFVVGSGMRLIPRTEWRHEMLQENSTYFGMAHFGNFEGRNLISVGLRGRCYDRDPPFQN